MQRNAAQHNTVRRVLVQCMPCAVFSQHSAIRGGAESRHGGGAVQEGGERGKQRMNKHESTNLTPPPHSGEALQSITLQCIGR